MNRDLVIMIKIYFGSALDVILFSLAAWDGIDHVLRTISAVGAIVVLWYLRRKYNQDHKLKKIEEEIKKIEAMIEIQTAKELIVRS